MAKGLTKRQEAILEYILSYVQNEGYPPSIREIGRDFEIQSLRGVTVHLDALERKGYISRSNTPRSIKVVHADYQPEAQVFQMPILGSIAAGAPILAEEHVEDMVPVSADMHKRAPDGFLLRVRGDSMTGDGIIDGDLVVIKPQQTASQNELVAFLLGNEATVKRVDYTPNGVRLLPSNPKYQPIPVDQDDARVIGKVVGLLRDY